MKLNPPASSSDLTAARSIARRLHQRAYATVAPDAGAETPLAARPPEPEAPRRPAPPPLPPRPTPPPPVVEPPVAREPEPPAVRQPAPRPEPPRRDPERRPEPPPRREPEPELPPRREPAPPPPPSLPERPWSEPPPRREWGEEEEREPEAPQIERGEPEAWAAPPPPRREEVWEPPAVVEDEEEDIEIEQPALAAESDVEEPVLEGPADEDDAFAALTGGGGPSRIEDLADEGPAFRPEPEQEFDESQFQPPEDLEPPPAPPVIEAPEFEPPGVDEPAIDQPEIDVDEDLLPAGGADDEAYEVAVDDGSAMPPGAEVSPEDLIGGPSDAPEPWAEEESPFDAEIEAAVGSPSPEDLVEVPAPPSWDDVADTCLGLAGARGAMLVESSGQVVSARGDWPNPGPEAIANRLVAMMERALRDAPTRSVSAPLAGQHLTAWRVPLGDSMLTAVFVGDTPVRADARTPIDEEIRQAAGV